MMNNVGISITLACLIALVGSVEPNDAAAKSALEPLLKRYGLRIASGHRQLLLVTAPRWSSSRGRLRRFRFDVANKRWIPVGAPIRVRLGKTGLGRGRGLAAPAKGPIKKEGDKRSPAGVFALGTAFGRLKLTNKQRGAWPWRHVDRGDRWIDDPKSPLYNTWQRVPAEAARGVAHGGARVPWRSAEKLARYELAIVVAHNTAPPIEKGAGSAIFLHSGSLKTPSVGCTMLRLGELKRVLRWLRPSAKPVLVQLPLRAWANRGS